MTGPDLLESGPDRRPPRAGRRRLLGTVAVLAVAVGGVLALRTGPEPDAPAPTPAPTRVAAAPEYFLYDVAVSAGRTYVLAGVCTDPPCGYQLLTRTGGRWASTPLDVPAGTAFPGRLLVTGAGDRYVVVADGARPGTYVSADGGRVFATAAGGTGPPVESVPAGLVAEIRGGGTGAYGVGVFDPASGRWRQLTHLPFRELRSVTATGAALYAVSREESAIVVASSTDGGHTWSRTTVTRTGHPTPVLRLVASGDGSTYLVVGRPLAGGDTGIASVWRSGPVWTSVLDYTRRSGGTPAYVDAAGMPAGVLLTDGATGGVQVLADGRTIAYELPADGSLVPGVLGPGTDGTVAAITMDGWHLLRHGRTGADWEVVPLP